MICMTLNVQSRGLTLAATQGKAHEDELSAVSKRQERHYRQVSRAPLPLSALADDACLLPVHEPQGRVQPVRFLSPVFNASGPSS